jgi:hypothetical protein
VAERPIAPVLKAFGPFPHFPHFFSNYLRIKGFAVSVALSILSAVSPENGLCQAQRGNERGKVFQALDKRAIE